MLSTLKRLILSAVATLAILGSVSVAPSAHAVTLTYLFSNVASTTLATGISSSSPSLQVISGTGALFPVIPQPGYAFIATLIKNGSPNIKEVVIVTGHTSGSDNFTGLIRGQDSTTALSWNAGDTVALLQPALAMNSFVQAPEAQAQFFNYAVDTGAANAYVVNISPAMNGHQVGTPIRWKASHSCTTNGGGSTFNDGFGAAALITPEGSAMITGSIMAGGLYEAVWDGTHFQNFSVHQTFFNEVYGSIANSQVPQSAVTQYQAALTIGTSQLSGTIPTSQLSGTISGSQLANNIAIPGSPTTTTQTTTDSSTKIATTAFANPSTNGASTGHVEFPGGIIWNWGVASYPGNQLSLTATFDKACTSTAYSAQANASIGGFQPGIQSLSSTSVTFNTNNLGTSTTPIYWSAVCK
jgi:hypothetical protein